MRSEGVFESVKVAEFQSLRNGQRFDMNGTKDVAGRFVLDDDFDFVGPFVIFKDGVIARFIGLGKRRILAPCPAGDSS